MNEGIKSYFLFAVVALLLIGFFLSYIGFGNLTGYAIGDINCAGISVDNCEEIVPGQSGANYEYLSEWDVYVLDDTSGADYYFILSGDLNCDRSCIVTRFVGQPEEKFTTTIDLNGYTLTYSGADYQTLSNNGFELWSGNNPINWNVLSGTVEARNTSYYQPMHGDFVLYTADALSIESSYVNLPIAPREYVAYATFGRAQTADLTIDVYDANNNLICSETSEGFFRGKSFGCKFLANNTGQYKMRITTQGYAYIDRTGIVPNSDYGVIGGSSYNYGGQLEVNYPGQDFQGSWDSGDLGDYNYRRPVLEVMNGNIRIGNENLNSYALRTSAAPMGKFHDLDVRVQGMQSRTVRTGGDVYNNHLEVSMPWYFARENSIEENVVMGSGLLYNNTLIGGQGVIRLGGVGTNVSYNYIRNNAQSTNHYAIIHSGAINPVIHNNVFDPIEGSGILVYSGNGYKITNNTFYVRTATCNVEYINEDYSTNAIRMNDYGSGSNHDNHVINNTFYIEGRDFETAYDNCMPVTTGIFYSAAGENNQIWNNKYYVTKTSAGDDSPVFAFYIGGDAYNNEGNPLFKDNYIETNDKALWINSFYGDSANQWLENNTFVRVDNPYYSPSMPESAIRFGYYRATAPGIRLINNHFENGFEEDAYFFTASTDTSLYDLSKQWYVNVRVTDASGTPLENAIVTAISTSSLPETISEITNVVGEARLIVTEYYEEGDMRSSGVHNRTSMTPHLFYVQYENTIEEVGEYTITQETDFNFALGTGGSCSTNGETRACGISEGQCTQGIQTCESGIWSVCVGAIVPSEEICDGIDNDCDYNTDEYLGETTCGEGICTNTIQNCVAGVPQTCNPFLGQQAESPLLNCGNSIDENCNGFDDQCVPEITSSPFDGAGGETTVEFICDIEDPTGIQSISLVKETYGVEQILETEELLSNKYYFLEAEKFNFSESEWDVCFGLESCEDNNVFVENTASALGHAISEEGTDGSSNMTYNLFLDSGTYSVFARSDVGGSDRTWQVGIENYMSPIFGDGSGGFTWENGLSYVSTTSGTKNIQIIDAAVDGYWTYPDLVLITDDLSFDPVSSCGVDALNLVNNFPARYSTAQCGLTGITASKTFNIGGLNGAFNWACSYVNGAGEEIISDFKYYDTETIPTCTDGDEDGYYLEAGGCSGEIGFIGHGDCNDENSNINPGEEEICDDLDNDCDSETTDGIDESWFGNETNCGIGACSNIGVFNCEAGVQLDTCAPGVLGSPELCDGLDNDCDESTEDGIDESWFGNETTCGIGSCVNKGILICEEGSQVSDCSPLEGVFELCEDGLDNDCDEFIDLNDSDCGEPEPEGDTPDDYIPGSGSPNGGDDSPYSGDDGDLYLGEELDSIQSNFSFEGGSVYSAEIEHVGTGFNFEIGDLNESDYFLDSEIINYEIFNLSSDSGFVRGKVYFKVPLSWIEVNLLNATDITLYSLSHSKEYLTSEISRDEIFVYFSSEVDSLGEVAIIARMVNGEKNNFFKYFLIGISFAILIVIIFLLIHFFERKNKYNSFKSNLDKN